MKEINLTNLHHTYIISGDREEILKTLIPFIEKEFGIKTKGNPDFFFQEFDSMYVEDARDIKIWQQNKTLDTKQFFVISAGKITPQAQNAFLKITEDPTPNTCFFFILPNQEALLPTLRSRAVVIEHQSKKNKHIELAKKFLESNPKDRLDIALRFHPKDKDKIDKEDIQKFLSALEIVLEEKEFSHDIYDIKKKIQASGVSVKTLLEHLAMVLPFKS